MANKTSPMQNLRKVILSALQDYTKSSVDFKVTMDREEAGEVPYAFFLAKVDPKKVVPEGTKEWDEFKWRTTVPVIYVDYPKADQQQINTRSAKFSSITEALENAIEEHIKVYDNGNEEYPARNGADPRLILIILLPTNIAIGPKWAEVPLPPKVSAKYKSANFPNLSDEQMNRVRHRIYLGDENDPTRVEWENEWTEWKARAAQLSILSTLKNLISKAMDWLRKLMHKDK
ncbi:hypothetical protein F5Y05DRAFT_424375 [Hypoxylon sp. FL0543]|nr:hypothetical protein F5Y05DRAFT_424375 [Hypoxylon sp. FL0543]